MRVNGAELGKLRNQPSVVPLLRRAPPRYRALHVDPGALHHAGRAGALEILAADRQRHRL